MSEVTRPFFAWLRTIFNRRRALRYLNKDNGSLVASISLVGDEPIAGEGKQRLPTLVGQPKDLSESGLSLILPTKFLRDRDLTEEGHIVRVVLSLPATTVVMQAKTVRGVQIDKQKPQKGFLIAFHILNMSDDYHARYTEYLRSLRSIS